MSELVRFSVAMPQNLLDALDAYAKRRGIINNRSEVIRDLIRRDLVQEESEDPDSLIFGTLTMVYNHHKNDLHDQLDHIQHAHLNEIVSTVHVHLNHEDCLEVVLMKGKSSEIRKIADALLGTKGVFNGQLVTTLVGRPEKESSLLHKHEDGHSHTHEHT
ncbi:MAG: nickel-responsive transcriptional regulator NikR, partial [Coriobacteriia bacterium]|nr:nickel-responsive transcriptional regulator NikR [Coriobacteriia bacterium]